jgi:hypothetical protein
MMATSMPFDPGRGLQTAPPPKQAAGVPTICAMSDTPHDRVTRSAANQIGCGVCGHSPAIPTTFRGTRVC